jgi:modification methylase
MSRNEDRAYLSATEVASFLKTSVKRIHELTEKGDVPVFTAPSGQYRYRFADIEKLQRQGVLKQKHSFAESGSKIEMGRTTQTVYIENAQNMNDLDDCSVHLVITSPPYFNAKMYSHNTVENDLGNIHSLESWYNEIGQVWQEVYRVLQPGRKFFLNIMNLPVRDGSSYRTLNLVGQSIDLCEKIGFIFKRDIVWHKTNGVRAHFGTYPYPGSILINNMHEFILEFNKPDKPGFKKYEHVSAADKEKSKLDKEFWLKLKNSDVWLIRPERSGDGRKHIAPFPLEIPQRLIQAYSYVGETVLDPFLGAGTTLIAAAGLERNGVGYEINEDIGMLAIQEIAGQRIEDKKPK